jgi:hypothetical protein
MKVHSVADAWHEMISAVSSAAPKLMRIRVLLDMGLSLLRGAAVERRHMENVLRPGSARSVAA